MHFSPLEERAGSLSIPRLQRLCHLTSELHPAKLRMVSEILEDEKMLHAISTFQWERTYMYIKIRPTIGSSFLVGNESVVVISI